ncbi:MAG: hypothetical protein HXX81_01370 [Campylobacterales bacterium]|nr:hypothetical protein [Campylobacterales bacterium]
MKKGIALLITIFLIMLLTLAILKSTDITDKYFKNVQRLSFFIQANKSLLDTIEVLKLTTKDINSSEALFILQALPILVEDKQSSMKLSLELNSGANRLNINRLIDSNNTINQPFYDLLQNILMKYEVMDSSYFFSILLDTLDNDSEERIFQSEIIIDEPFFTNGKIVSIEHLKYILDYYVEKRDDINIKKIPWNEFFDFESQNSDFNYLDYRLINFIVQGIANDNTFHDEIFHNYEEIGLTDEDKKKFESIKINFFEPLLNCRMKFNYLDQQITIDFLYDIKNKKAYNFEVKI